MVIVKIREVADIFSNDFSILPAPFFASGAEAESKFFSTGCSP
jgi:hypothetical protein